MSVDTDRIREKLRSLERRRRVRQTLAVASTVVVLWVTFVGLRFLGFELDDILGQLPQMAEFLAGFVQVDFVDLTLYTKEQEINGLDAIPASFGELGARFFESLRVDRMTLVRASFVTVVIGFTGTVLGFPLALLFGVLGSERVTPFPFNFLFRGTMSAIRAIPALVWILIYVPLSGISPVSAVFAIATDTIGNLGRLFTDELEEIDDGPIEAIQSTGASKSQTVGFGMLSQVSTSFIAWTLYIVEINTRIAISLGVVGAGGIGLYINSQRRLLDYGQMAAGIVMVFVIVLSIELLSSRIRARLRPGEHETKGLIERLRDLGNTDKWIGRNVDPD